MKKLIVSSLILLSSNIFGQITTTLDSGLVAYYPFNGNARDSSGYGNHGTVEGASPTTDRFGISKAAYNFDGIDDHIEFDSTFTFIFHEQGNATLSFWINQNSIKHESIFWARGDDVDRNRFNVYTNYENWNFGVDYRTTSGTRRVIFRTDTDVARWVFFTITRQDNLYRLFVDGKFLIDKIDLNPDLPTYQGQWYIGRRTRFMYSGMIDDVRIYNRALSEVEIRKLFSLSECPKCSNPSIASISDVPNDQGKQVTVLWNRACPDTAGSDQSIRFYGVWRRADQITVAKTSMGAKTQTPAVKAVDSFDDMMVAAHNATPGSSYQVKGGNPASTSEVWTFVGAAPALQFEQYSFDAPTLFDSTATYGIVWSVFFISAHTNDPLVWYKSQPDSGYSVDNLVPSAPTNLTAIEKLNDQGASLVRLTWDKTLDEDFDCFVIVRGTESEFDPNTAETMAKTTEPTFIDDRVSIGSEFFYRVVAFDFSGNRGEFSEEVSLLVTSVAGDPDLQIPTEFALEQNHPNPFNPETSIQYQLPKAGHVELLIYNLLGEKVRTLFNEQRAPGIYQVQWHGKNDAGKLVSSGVYVYRIKSGEFVQTRKMLLLR